MHLTSNNQWANLGSHVFVVTCTLGWDDGTSSTHEVEGMACDCYT
jgi:hypothetical protein